MVLFSLSDSRFAVNAAQTDCLVNVLKAKFKWVTIEEADLKNYNFSYGLF
jgi:hypothetical protein